jgi:hypothetical protein
MPNRARTTALVHAFTLVATLSIGQAVARADAPAPTPAGEGAAARRAGVKHSPAARAHEGATDDQTLYTCHPKEDLSCTVIHETTRGIVVVTFRPTGAREKRVWSVVNAPAEPSSASTGGTIYVVPATSRPVSDVQPTTQISENSSPILD